MLFLYDIYSGLYRSFANRRNYHEKIKTGTVHMKNIYLSLRKIFAKIIIPPSLNVVKMLYKCCVNVV